MKRILFIPSTMNGGVYYYRVYTPMKCLVDNYSNEFDVTIDNHWKFTDEEKDEIGKSFDIVLVHNGLYTSMFQDEFWRMIIYCKKEYGTKFILDIDDYWEYHKKHPAYNACVFNAFPEKMMINFNLFDYVTTTTEYFKAIISQYFPEEKILVFENAISTDDKQFTEEKTKSDKIRIGLTGGSSHTDDIKQILEFPKYLTDKQLDQIEMVFCGYNDKDAEKITIDDNGKIVDRKPLDDKENWWIQTENKLKTMFKYYRRVETKDIMKGEFGLIYKDIDIVLVPLTNNKFNRCKSELKFIEAGFTNTAVLSSNVIPYNNFGENEYDCIIFKENTPECLAKTIKKILRDKDYIKIMAERLNSKVTDLRNLEEITRKRANFLRKL